MQLWDRGYWAPEGGMTPRRPAPKGDLKFVLEGERLHGSWVLVRMKHDRSGGKRTNWLLIKHRDEYARDGDGDAVLAEDRSVASGRAMAEIAAGKGRGAEAVHERRRSADADAVWTAARSGAEKALRRDERASEAPTPSAGREASRAVPDFIEPQLCQRVERPPSGAGWVHEIKFDGYRMQLRVEGGERDAADAQGARLDGEFPAIARAAAQLPDGIIDGEVVALDEHGAPDFAALQAALSEGKTDDLVFFAFDLLFDGGEDLRALPLAERKARLRSDARGQCTATR